MTFLKKFVQIILVQFIFFLMTSMGVLARNIPLYTGKIPLNLKVENSQVEKISGNGITSDIRVPSLLVYLPKNKIKKNPAVIICPGGGYSILAMNHEGKDIAKLFNQYGIAAFVLKYRIPNEKIMDHKENAPLMDAQQAIYLVRKYAKEYFIDPEKIGIMGFSAGGHVASSLGTHYQSSFIYNPELINLRPNFMILCYPVISMDPIIGHKGSRENLLGENPADSLKAYYSNENHVSPSTPPTFLMHATDDSTVSVENSLRFFEALKTNHVKTEMHIFQSGGHGFGLNNPTTKVKWFDQLVAWIEENHWL